MNVFDRIINDIITRMDLYMGITLGGMYVFVNQQTNIVLASALLFITLVFYNKIRL